jgi:2-dehydro-3-deoxyphosphogluconate aldolase/(4S)-4-hydroxy-2-oxoglutarate aldolase
VGTVFDAATAQRVCAAGARIVVSPITDAPTGAVCAAAGVDWLPGAFTPTEIAFAERSGATQVKLFPALAINAPAFLRSVLATRAASRIIPTNVSLEEIAPLVAAGAAGFGVGDRLLNGADPRSAAAITERLRAALAAAGGVAY